jgi:hypothetical protein
MNSRGNEICLGGNIDRDSSFLPEESSSFGVLTMEGERESAQR